MPQLLITDQPMALRLILNVLCFACQFELEIKMCLSKKEAKIRNQYNQVPHLTQDTNGKVT